MLNSRRFAKSGADASYRGPGAEMLASDAATEFRSFTLLYEQYADRLYRCLLAGTGDVHRARTLLDDLISRLPRELERFPVGERSFDGWLFSLAVKQLHAGQGGFGRLSRYASRVLLLFTGQPGTEKQVSNSNDLDVLLHALQHVPPYEREVLGVFVAADLPSNLAAEAIGLPTSLLSSNADRAIRSLAEAMGERRSMDAAERFYDQFSVVTVPSEQRERHLNRAYRSFAGQDEEVQEQGSLGRDVGVIVALLVLALVTVVAWEVITAEGEPEPEEDQSSVASGVDDQATPTAEATQETDPAIAADDDDLGVCSTSDSKRVARTFVRAFNNGDTETLEELLPATGEEAGQLDVSGLWDGAGEPRLFQHESATFDDRNELMPFLEDRHAAGERWEPHRIIPDEQYREFYEVMTAESFQRWWEDNPGLAVMFIPEMTWFVETDEWSQSGYGRVVVDCEDERILSWSMVSGSLAEIDPVPVDDFLQAAEPLGPGEMRSVTARVSTTRRSDGGGLFEWEIEWWQARDENGAQLEFINIRTLGGESAIQFVDGGSGWRLNQRGWRINGDINDEIPLPEEITLARPWLEATYDLMLENAESLTPSTSTTIGHDISDASGTGMQQWFEVRIEDGGVSSSRFRIGSVNGEMARPQLRFLEVHRYDELEDDRFEIGTVSPFTDLEIGRPRYDVPTDEWDDLDYIAFSVIDGGMQERHRLTWDGVPLDLTVMPSRGGLDDSYVPDVYESDWERVADRYSEGMFIWGSRPNYDFPTDAYWDDGRFRYHLQLIAGEIDEDDEWNRSGGARHLRIIIEALSTR